jgi:hypothetical protein
MQLPASHRKKTVNYERSKKTYSCPFSGGEQTWRRGATRMDVGHTGLVNSTPHRFPVTGFT